MSKKYESLAKSIVELVGGKGNVNDVYHCQTRLRFKLADESLAKDKELEVLDGVGKIIRNAGVFQVVIGVHVADVYEEIEKFVEIKKDNLDDKSDKKGIMNTIISFVSETFQPIIPALSGAGMVKAIMALLVVFNLIDNQSQTYYLLNLFSDGVFYFLPMMIAFTEAKKLKCNPIMAAGVAAMMLHPNWLALVAAEEAVYFFEVIPFTLTSYASSVIPIIIVVLVQSYVEKILKKIIPKCVELVFVPMFTFLIMGTLAFAILGPIGSILGGYLGTFFLFLSTNASWVPAVLIGGLLPVMVMFGLHNGVAPLGVMQMADIGYDSIFGPGCVCSNMAQATAGLVVTLRTRDKKIKQTAAAGSITAYMGITEPILYGVNLPKRYPLIAAMIGGGLGGLYAGLTQTHRFATGSSGLPAVLLYIGNDTMRFFVNIIIAIAISIIVTAILTLVLSFKFEKDIVESTGNTAVESVAETVSEIENIEVTMKEDICKLPVSGKVVPISEAADEAFASSALGQGIAVNPTENVVVAPCNGIVDTVFFTKHALGFRSENGMEILIHIGIDTVQLDGKHFTAFVEQGDKVKAGQKIVEFDREAIEKDGYSTQTMVIVANSNDYEEVQILKQGVCKVGDDIIRVL